jgi:dsRNA-specific ribonuclease
LLDSATKQLRELLGFPLSLENARLVLTHSSNDGKSNNEALAFLGDAVVELAVRDPLFRAHPDWKKGALTDKKRDFVRNRELAKLETIS